VGIVASSDLFLFVSHVAENRDAAMEIVGELERRGTRCWIAPRDVRPGEAFDNEIADAIETSRAMLLIFSDLCNDSEYIRREVTVAGESHKTVIPFRIEDVQPRRGLRVRLSDLHWIDGFTSRERAIDEVIKKFAPSPHGPVTPSLNDDGQQNVSNAKIEPKAADTIAQSPPIMTVTPDVAAKEPITPPAKPKPVAAQDDHRGIADTAAPRDQGGHETASSTDIARPLPTSLKEKIPEVRKDPDLRTTARAPSNINFRLVVCALLVLQGIGRAGFGIYATFEILRTNGNDVLPALILIGWGAPGVVIAFGIARQKRWARVLGWIVVGFGAIIDGGFILSGNLRMDVTISLILSVVIDFVVIIYLIRGYRPSSPKA
jgi:hypothetical protein